MTGLDVWATFCGTFGRHDVYKTLACVALLPTFREPNVSERVRVAIVWAKHELIMGVWERNPQWGLEPLVGDHGDEAPEAQL